MDDAETVRADWSARGIYDILDSLYSEIWIYGNQDFYDPIVEYDIPESISPKVFFTGYISRKTPDAQAITETRQRHSVKPDENFIVVTTGGGGDGYAVMDTFLSMLEALPGPPPFKCVLITGPFMPKPEREKTFQRARKLNIQFFHFYRQMEKILAAADLVITMGGYNTLCEILSQGSIPLIIPRETPRKEQLIRAQAFHKHHLVDYIPWHDLTPKIVAQKVFDLLENPEPYQRAVSRFQMTGVDFINQRLTEFCVPGSALRV
jgi:predicted glycosyltransferase